jgi:pyridine nucleotide-disulfide oxidoreductase family protein
MKRLVLLGGGHAHVEVLRSLAENPGLRPEVTLVTPFPRLIYTGMVPGVIAGHYRLEECAIALDALAQRAGAAYVQGRAAFVSANAREVMCADGGVVPYDVLSIDVGSVPVIGSAQGVERHAVPVRPLEDLMKGWGSVLARARAGKVTSITIVGGGAAGVELALAMDHRLRRELGAPAPHVRVITNTPVAVPEFSDGARRRLRRHLAKRNVGMHVSSTVAEVGADHVRLDTGLEFASDATFWAAGAGAHPWIHESGFATDARGFLLTNDRLQSVTYREVFGAGDCATQEAKGLAKAGVFAVRAAPILAANLRAALGGGELAAFRTDPRYLALVSTGPRHAVGNWNGLGWQGGWVWRWKDRIDRNFVARYSVAAAVR